MSKNIFKRRSFVVIDKGMDVFRFLKEYEDGKHFLNKKRAGMYMDHRETEAVSLTLNGSVTPTKSKRCHRQDIFLMKESDYFPLIGNYVQDFAKKRNSSVAKISIVSLRGNGQVYRHYDFGGYYILRERFHIVLKSEGSIMKVGDEELMVNEGDFFYLNNRDFHSVANLGDSERVHIIFDLLPNSFFARMQMFLLWFMHERKLQKKMMAEIGNDWSYNFWRTILFGQRMIDSRNTSID